MSRAIHTDATPTRARRRCLAPALALCLLAGCAADRSQMDRTLMRDNGQAGRSTGVVERYVVHCPDVLTLSIPKRSDLGGSKPVDVDGRIDLPDVGRLRVEGKSLPEIQELVAWVAHSPASQVQVGVAEFKSQHVYVFGQVVGLQRAVPYQGQETVVDVLHRVGGITAGAAANDVYLVRPHLNDGKAPEVFHVDLRAVLMNKDERTNVRVQPFDEIYVGESRHSCVEKCIPPWIRPLYESLCGLTRRGSKPFAGIVEKMTLNSRLYALRGKTENLDKR